MKKYAVSLMYGLRVALWAVTVGLLTGCAAGSNPKDPFEHFNRGMLKVNDSIDRAVLKPVAKGYRAAIPLPLRGGIDSFVGNLRDLPSALNSLLQGKLIVAASDSGRFIVNSSIGILGLFDVASRIGLPRHDEDFGQTMGYWGIGAGPYLILPLLGPSTVRDTGGLVVDFVTSPSAAILNDKPGAEWALLGVRVVSQRAALLDSERLIEEAAIDRYAFLREAYLQRRERLINDGASSIAPLPPPKRRKSLKELEEELDAEDAVAPVQGNPP